MRLCAGQASAKFTFLSGLGATCGTTNRQGLFALGYHGYIMQRCSAKRCSIVTTPFTSRYNRIGHPIKLSPKKPA